MTSGNTRKICKKNVFFLSAGAFQGGFTPVFRKKNPPFVTADRDYRNAVETMPRATL